MKYKLSPVLQDKLTKLVKLFSLKTFSNKIDFITKSINNVKTRVLHKLFFVQTKNIKGSVLKKVHSK